MRCFGLGLLGGLLAVLGDGCGKSQPGGATGRETPAAGAQTILRLHWRGKDQIAADTNSASLMGIWKLVETAKIEAQTLDKLAEFLAGEQDHGLQDHGPQVSGATNQLPTIDHQLSTNASHASSNQLSTINPPLSTNASSIHHQLSTNASLLRPLLDDLVLQESYLEMRRATNQAPEFALAIRLNDQRAALWEKRLQDYERTGLRDSGTAGPRDNKTTGLQDHIQAARAGEWTVVGLAAHGQNSVLSNFVSRIQAIHVPYPPLQHSSSPTLQFSNSPSLHSATNWWFEAELDLRALSDAFSLGWELPSGLPKLSLSMAGEAGENVRTVGQLKFPKPLALELDPWNVPTNLIHDPLVSFTAMRGIRPWLQGWSGWTNFDVKTPPNQAYFWGQRSAPFLTYVAAPLPNASNAVSKLTSFLQRDGNLWLATNSDGKFERATNFDGTGWTGLGFMFPFVESAVTNGSEFVFGGLNPPSPARRKPLLPPPSELLGQLARTNLVAYEWELTEARVEQWVFNGQFLRMTFHKAQLPSKAATLAWFKNAGLKLGNCVTLATQTAPDELSLTRRSTIGFSGLELHLLADWLESPKFPIGLHTLLAPARFPARPQTTGPRDRGTTGPRNGRTMRLPGPGTTGPQDNRPPRLGQPPNASGTNPPPPPHP